MGSGQITVQVQARADPENWMEGKTLGDCGDRLCGLRLPTRERGCVCEAQIRDHCDENVPARGKRSLRHMGKPTLEMNLIICRLYATVTRLPNYKPSLALTPSLLWSSLSPYKYQSSLDHPLPTNLPTLAMLGLRLTSVALLLSLALASFAAPVAVPVSPSPPPPSPSLTSS